MSIIGSTLRTARSHHDDDDGVQQATQELDNLIQIQQRFVSKVSLESEKRDFLLMKVQDATAAIETIKRRLGDLQKENRHYSLRKAIQRVETQIERSRTNLGTTETELAKMRTKIDTVRREKLQLYTGKTKLEQTIQQKLSQQDAMNNEIKTMNERKSKIKSELSSLRQQVVADMETFATEIDNLKSKIYRAKLNSARRSSPKSMILASRGHTNRTDCVTANTEPAGVPDVPLEIPTEEDLAKVLEQTNMADFESLHALVLQYEEEEFHLYQSLLTQNEELEDMQNENVANESFIEKEDQILTNEDDTADTKRRVLDAELAAVHLKTEQFEGSYQAYFDLLRSLADSIRHVVKNVCTEDDSTTQSVITNGINDRTLEPALGLLEARIDELLQMSKAAGNEDIGLDDLIKPPEPDIDGHGRVPAVRTPMFPDAQQDNGDDDEDSIHPVNVAELQQLMTKHSRPNSKVVQHRPRLVAPRMRRGTLGVM